MPLQKLQFRPGVNRESTTLTNEGGWFESEKIRFRSGSAEKIGGWVQDTGTTNSALAPPVGAYWGLARSMWNWVTLASYNLLAVGTNLKYYIQSGVGGIFFDITPIRFTADAGDTAFFATTGSPILAVVCPAYGAQQGDFVTFSGAVGLGGNMTAAVLNAEFRITSLISNNAYTITAAVNATSADTGNGGSSVISAYQINTGLVIASANNGWGTGGWSGVNPPSPLSVVLSSAINNSVTTIPVAPSPITVGFAATGVVLIDSELITYTGRTATDLTGCTRGALGTVAASHLIASLVIDATTFTGWGEASPATTGVISQLRLWSQSNYGQDLIFNPRGGALYYWAVNPNPNIFDRATQITSTNAPFLCNFVMVSDASRFVIGFGVNDYVGSPGELVQNPMLIRWSDQQDYTSWTPAITNQAGSYTLSHGSNIITAMQSRQEILVWTDAALYSMQYLGPPYVWGLQILADNISIAGPNVATSASNITYWMGADKFYMYSGRVETLPCTLRSYVFNDINMSQAYQFFSGTNEGFNEIWWYYCSANSTVIDKYVVYNHLERIWYYGTMGRSAWLDSPLRAQPMATTYNAQLVYHETGVDDGTTTPPSPIVSYVQSSDFDIGDGHNFGFVWRIIPDVTFDGSTSAAPTLDFTVRPRQFPGTGYGNSNNPPVISSISYAGQRTYNVQQFTEQVYVRVRGRQMAFKVGSTELGTQWQLGTPRMDVRPDGRR